MGMRRFTKSAKIDAGQSPMGIAAKQAGPSGQRKPSRCKREGYEHERRVYARTTFAACRPFGPFSKSNSTLSPSLSVR